MDSSDPRRLSVSLVDVTSGHDEEFLAIATHFEALLIRKEYGHGEMIRDEGHPRRFYAVRYWTDATAAERFHADPEAQALTAGLYRIARVTHVVNGVHKSAAMRLMLDDRRARIEADRRTGFDRRVKDAGRSEGNRRVRERRIGPRRVQDWLDGRGALLAETRHYVLTITGRSADEWAAARFGGEGGGDKAPVQRTSCGELMTMLKAQPSPFIGELERRVREGGERPWGVELSAGFVRERVLAAYAMVEKTYRNVLENRDPIIVARTFRSRGTQTFYQVRIGTDTRAGANELCGTLRRAGGACFVLRNGIADGRRSTDGRAP